MQISNKMQALCANNCGRRLSRNNYFCSNICKTAAYRKTVIDAFYAGTLEPTPFFNGVVRQHLLHLFHERCQQCGWNEKNAFSGKVPVEVEHIDGDWRNIAPDNLTVLCPNCHSLTKTFRGLNRGRGRPGRPGTRTRNATGAKSQVVSARTRQRYMTPPNLRYAEDELTLPFPSTTFRVRHRNSARISG